ncbi:glycosyltransferase family 2 protein [Pseudothauera rhizosphaerae]|uniref:Glycosyltransferase family 2 protein n=1 Tax=Pseudothauera rhizosphaerae TaxID=2565932 RepID=A0A4S4AH49_9RHOO|nr:glycosyltransferase family 2 protein [Pseudothauera rhizosphaerae]THF57644.1 glycosyltransferase family 2 protein [Pseudothauera rhizosphaerae]
MIKKLRRRLRALWCRLKLALRWRFRRPAPAHGRNRELVVSLTSYPKRFSSLHLTLRSLLTQSVRPDRVILWLAEADRSALPAAVEALQQEGLEIRYCDDLRSFKKIIPTLSSFPEADIVTADDDLYYWSDWLKELVVAAERFPGKVVAHRLHKVACDGHGIRSYREWPKNISDQTEDPRNFATGCLGVFYPAGCFHPDVLDRDAFMRLCPEADDVWLYWMVRRNGRFEVHSGTRHGQVNWPGSQQVSLWKRNRHRHGNDAQIQAMVETYGRP